MEEILEKVRLATHKVLAGEVACERDSIVFEKATYPLPLIALLLRAAIERNGRLNVLDFGGALGSSYYQTRDFLASLPELRWCVVEQPHFVECGRREFQNSILQFYDSLNECMQAMPLHVVLASGVLQYLPDPTQVLASFVHSAPDYIVIDRTPISISGKQMISIQSVPSEINLSSYPLWIFNEHQLKAPLLKDYKEIACFDAVDGTLGTWKMKAAFKGFIFQKRIGTGTA